MTAGRTLLLAAVLALGQTGCGGGDTAFLPSAEDLLVAPEAISVAAADGEITIQWSAVPDAIGYHLYWSNAKGVTRRNGNPLQWVDSP